MSVARTARRRRKQYATGNLAAIYGEKHAPRYKKRSTDTLAKREAEFRQRRAEENKRAAAGKGKK